MKSIPKFSSEKEESEFFENFDSTEFIDWSKGTKISFSNLKPTLKSISIRLPEILIARLKQESNKMDIPYQSLLKIILNEGLDKRQMINN
jgi:predicted DNA binding CopG/RHH family protein